MTKETNQEVVLFNPKEIATMGNKMINAILTHEMRRNAAEEELRAADGREGIIDTELTKVALFLHNNDQIDLHSIYEGKDEVGRLNRALLVAIGVMVRTENLQTDKIEYEYSDKEIKAKYSVSKPAEDAPEEVQAAFIASRSRRNALNIRLRRVMKAALALADAKATPDESKKKQNRIFLCIDLPLLFPRLMYL